MADLKSQK